MVPFSWPSHRYELASGAELGNACFLSGSSTVVRSRQTPQSSDSQGKLLLPRPFRWWRQQNMLSAVSCLLSIGADWPANPGGCYSRSLCFLTYLLTIFLTLQASALTKQTCDKGSNGNRIIWFGFQSWWPGCLHFSLAFICVCLLCLSFVLIALRGYKTPALTLPSWIRKSWRCKPFGARFLQIYFFFLCG